MLRENRNRYVRLDVSKLALHEDSFSVSTSTMFLPLARRENFFK
jgi:hypothetical protein